MAERGIDTAEPDVKAITRALSAPFDDTEVKFKPQAVKGNRALALAYVDVRAIMDRLDNVLGVANWQDHYQLLPDNSVMCRLRLRIGDRWITKTDVGGPSEQPDGGDRLKAAFSDALKRAAVKFGIGRYLYRLPHQWADYDPQKRQFAAPPRLPDWAVSKAAKPAPRPAASTGRSRRQGRPRRRSRACRPTGPSYTAGCGRPTPTWRPGASARSGRCSPTSPRRG